MLTLSAGTGLSYTVKWVYGNGIAVTVVIAGMRKCGDVHISPFWKTPARFDGGGYSWGQRCFDKLLHEQTAALLEKFAQLLALGPGEPFPRIRDKLDAVGDPDIPELLKKRDRHHPAAEPLPDPPSLPFAGPFALVEEMLRFVQPPTGLVDGAEKTIPFLPSLSMRETSMQGMPSE